MPPNEPPARWREAAVSDAASGIDAAALELPPWFAPILARRGIESTAEAGAFLHPTLDQLHAPALLQNLERAVDRLIAARDEGQTVVVVGDYDVDGVTATALLLAVFRACGIATEPVLPHRLRDGYGFQPAHVDRAVALGASLVVTADCGSRSLEAAKAALERGIDVIVTDHHLPGEPHDSRVVHVNPLQPGATYPFPHLSGAGLALKLATAVAERCGRPVPPEPLLRVTCLGTIADMVPLRGENRVIARLGLEALADTRSAGLRALMDVAGVGPRVRATDVGFRLGPRLNAAGRMDSADVALELLMERDTARAAELAARLDTWNSERRGAERRVVDEASQKLEELDRVPPIVTLWSEAWHRGVVGIAAGRIARRLHRPTVLLAVEDGIATGSGRSIPGIHLHDFLSTWEDRLERFGGHAQAIGLTARVEDLDGLTGEWKRDAAGSWDPDLLVRTYEYDAHLGPAEVTLELVEQLRRLEPFGVGNRDPLIRVGPLSPAAPPRFFGEEHVGLVMRGDDGARLDLVGWRWRDRVDVLTARCETLGHVERDGYTGRPVLRLVAARPLQ